MNEPNQEPQARRSIAQLVSDEVQRQQNLRDTNAAYRVDVEEEKSLIKRVVARLEQARLEAQE